MPTHLQHEVEKLQAMILSLAAVVEDDVVKAVRSVEERDAELAQSVIDADVAIDCREVNIEEECLKILALHQPVARDLRFIVAVLKVNSDIERVGDLAVNVAERALSLCTRSPIEPPFSLYEMRAKALAMLKGSLDALMKQDPARARQVRASDDEVDAINREMYAKFTEAIRENAEHVESLLSYLSVSRHLERIADYATNIAEDVIYVVEGEIVRHKPTVPEP